MQNSLFSHNKCIAKEVFKGRHTRWDLSLQQVAGLVASCELAIFATKSSCRDQFWSPPQLVPQIQTGLNSTNSNWFGFLGLVAGTKVGPCDLLQGLVSSCVLTLTVFLYILYNNVRYKIEMCKGLTPVHHM